MLAQILMGGVAGAVGTLSRLGLTAVVTRRFELRFPWGTALVNIVGCFLFGLIWALTEQRSRSAETVRYAALGGFMGAFTTFSTLIFDVVSMAAEGRYAAAAGNLVLQNTTGILALLLGLWVGRRL